MKNLEALAEESTRKTSFTFDHGAQFLKIKLDFKSFFSLFEKIIQPWNFKLAYFDKYHLIQNKDEFFVGVPNMDSILKHLSKKCDVLLNTQIEE